MIFPPHMQNLPRLPITMREALDLPEYSATLPTGTTAGKRWRRHDGVFDPRVKARGMTPFWVICEYYDGPDVPEGRIGIRYYRPVIRVKALHG